MMLKFHQKVGCWIFLLLVGCIFSGSGCAHKPEDQTARYFADKGIEEFKDGDYRKAIEFLEKLRDWYPFSKYTILADLKIADAYFELVEYETAIASYIDFERLHPRNEAIPFVIYRIGLCYYNRLDTIDRDQASAEKTIETFRRLQNRFPNNEYSEKSKEMVRKCRQSLAGHELYVGMFYYKSEHYQAARHRFQAVIDEYPEVGNLEQAHQHILLCDKKIAEQNLNSDSNIKTE